MFVRGFQLPLLHSSALYIDLGREGARRCSKGESNTRMVAENIIEMPILAARPLEAALKGKHKGDLVRPHPAVAAWLSVPRFQLAARFMRRVGGANNLVFQWRLPLHSQDNVRGNGFTAPIAIITTGRRMVALCAFRGAR